MRRSIRDAMVGFSLLGAVATFAGSLIWLKGIRIGANAWTVTANFSDASGLAERSPVTYRGILVGSVGEIKVTPRSVQATLDIDKSNLRLPLPVFAKVVTGSLLGGDVQVALFSRGKSLAPSTPRPRSEECPGKNILCHGDTIRGEPLTSISTLTESLERVLIDSEDQEVVSHLVSSTKQFDLTQKNLDELVAQMKTEVTKAEAMITNLIRASGHLTNILAAFDNPQTLKDLQETARSTRSLTAKIDAMGSDVEKLMEDKELMNAVRNLTVGLGELFNELYPSKMITP
ncbi:MlaD family protein [Prochlorococcus sp. MIT 1300]|uniref:MlaD family protein n=1 Tax=Prochlorococcus sp. MIT 1300 TaxID=3096218 RepID=UPI002A74DA56|nr:MlaD family protein [Prochlorococcus sp. MIT 1300]